MAPQDEPTIVHVGGPPVDANAAGIPSIGEVIAGKYRVERVLGVGGMGVVLAVTHLQLNEPYAIKCLLPGGAADPETVERFMREARASVRIKSEHIVRVSDVGRLENGAPYILMEYLKGQDLSDVLEVRGSLSVQDAVEYVLQACTGIAEAHALGIVHRDLKPSNLFLTPRLDGASLVKVLDFGISKAVGDAPHKPSLTQTASVFGSPAYMSPEQIRSAKNVDHRTDIWALGVILFEFLTGQLPFIAETSGGLLSAIAADDPVQLRALRPDAGDALDAIVARCLEKNVQRRFQSVSELATALEPFRGAGSLVSLGRIQRLSVPAVSQDRPASSPNLRRAAARTVDAGAATDKAWTAPPQPPTSSRALAVLVSASLLVALGAGGVYAAKRLGQQGAPATTSQESSSLAATAPSPPSAAPIAAPVVAPPPTAVVSAAPSVTPSPTAPAAPVTVKVARPGHVASARPASSGAPAVRREAPAPSPTTPATTSGAPLDPLGSTH